MSNNALNVYKPSVSAHGTLYWQYNNSDISPELDIIFSGSSAEEFSYVLMIDGKSSKNLKLFNVPTLKFVPGYNNQYLTNKTHYALTFSNQLGSAPLIIKQAVLIYNS